MNATPPESSERRTIRSATVPLRKLIPNLITIAAMCSGVASLYFSSKLDPATLTGDDGNLKRAVAAIGMAAILDALDGRAARFLKATSRFGETLDSLSDFVSFGVAPAVLVYRWSQGATLAWGVNLDRLLLICLIAFAVCSALRLARFTAMQRRKKLAAKPSPYFTGLPTPAAAGAALVPPMIMLSDLGVRVPVYVVMPWMLLIAAHMISRIPMYSGKGLRVPRPWVLPLMVLIATVVAAFAQDAWLTASAICVGYVFTLPLSMRAAARHRAAMAAGAVS
ncbi:MAG: CDP-alcohol phosphatidyltransferase family protein [Phycisphaerales bacterium]